MGERESNSTVAGLCMYIVHMYFRAYLHLECRRYRMYLPTLNLGVKLL